MNWWQSVAHLVSHATGTSWREQLMNIAMPIFFFYVGHEIRVASHEKVRGLISPVAAALGGMLFPATIFLTLANVWDLPAKLFGTTMATDLPLVLLVLAALPKHFTARIRHYILVLAVADDLGSIVILAILFNKKFELSWIFAQLALVVALYFARKNPLSVPLILLGWWVSLHSGFQPTVVAAIMGAMVTIRSRDLLIALERTSYFICIPIFLFAVLSEGITIASLQPQNLGNHTSIAIMVARIIGKPVGIICGAWVAHKIAHGGESPQLSRREIRVVSSMGIFGLSVSLLFLHLSGVTSVGAATSAIIYINVVGALIALGWSYFLTRATAA